MKKIYVFSLFIILILSIFASPVLAKDNTQNEGQPFKDLWDAIKSLWDAINNIESRVEALENIFGGIKWEGDNSEPWLHNNSQLLDLTKTLSRCGCPGLWNCPHETFATSDGDITIFDSGPKHADKYYQGDGMKFWLEDIAVVPDAEHEVEFNITDLDARVDESVGAESKYMPRWTLYVMENDEVIASLSEQWGTIRCKDCNPNPSSLGVRTLTFTPLGNSVNFYFVHSYGTDQCMSSVYHVKMALDYFYVTVAD